MSELQFFLFSLTLLPSYVVSAAYAICFLQPERRRLFFVLFFGFTVMRGAYALYLSPTQGEVGIWGQLISSVVYASLALLFGKCGRAFRLLYLAIFIPTTPI